VQSTKLISSISSSEKIRRYYSIFVNSISTIAKKFGAKIIRNEGDSVICLFAGLYDLTRNKSAFEAVIEFGMYIISYRTTLSRHMTNEKLPSINYRVIADYGAVEMAKSTSSARDELFGPFIKRCSNLKKISVPNSFMIGADLQRLVKEDMNCRRLTISGKNYLIQFE
jgi:two-component system response regulator ChvI